MTTRRRVKVPGTTAMWEWLPKLMYHYKCVGGAHKQRGCGHTYTDKGSSSCPKCGNMYVKQVMLCPAT